VVVLFFIISFLSIPHADDAVVVVVVFVVVEEHSRPDDSEFNGLYIVVPGDAREKVFYENWFLLCTNCMMKKKKKLDKHLSFNSLRPDSFIPSTLR
jgi:hypothetical protein